jgi:hypothetical protein
VDFKGIMVTPQQSEVLRCRGREFAMRDFPLNECTCPQVRERIGQIQMVSTALWRGYPGIWAIKAGRLWLESIEATVQLTGVAANGDQQFAERGLSWLFPDVAGPVPADWSTGTIESPRGRVYRTSMFGCQSSYVRLFHLEAGVVIGTELKDNRAAVRAGVKRHAKFSEFLG